VCVWMTRSAMQWCVVLSDHWPVCCCCCQRHIMTSSVVVLPASVGPALPSDVQLKLHRLEPCAEINWIEQRVRVNSVCPRWRSRRFRPSARALMPYYFDRATVLHLQRLCQRSWRNDGWQWWQWLHPQSAADCWPLRSATWCIELRTERRN